MAVLLVQRPVLSLSDVDFPAVDYTRYLRARINELLDDDVTPTVVSLGKVSSYEDDGTPVYVANSDITLSNPVVSGTVLDMLEKPVAIGKAVQWKVVGMQPGITYGIRVTASTNSVPPRTKVVDVLIRTAK